MSDNKLVHGHDAAFWFASYDMLRTAVLQHLARHIIEDDVAEEAIYVEAIEKAGKDVARVDWLTDTAASTAKIIGVAGVCYGSAYIGRKRVAEGDDVRDALDVARGAPDTEGIGV